MKTSYKQREAKYRVRLKGLRLFDDVFMTKCFEGSVACVELLLRIVMVRPGLKVLEIHTQYDLINLQGRSLRLDVLAVDVDGRYYNIEIQRDDDGANPHRARYHSSLVDANILPAGVKKLDTLPEVYVIFITEHDVLHGGQPVYHVERTIRETGKLFGDGSHILYVNGAYRGDTPVGKLMHDFSCTDPADMHYAVLAERVRYFKENEEGVKAMSKFLEELLEEDREELLEEGRAEGRAEGRTEGREENLISNIKSLMVTLHLTIDQAMDALRIPAEKQSYYQGLI